MSVAFDPGSALCTPMRASCKHSVKLDDSLLYLRFLAKLNRIPSAPGRPSRYERREVLGSVL